MVLYTDASYFTVLQLININSLTATTRLVLNGNLSIPSKTLTLFFFFSPYFSVYLASMRTATGAFTVKEKRSSLFIVRQVNTHEPFSLISCGAKTGPPNIFRCSSLSQDHGLGGSRTMMDESHYHYHLPAVIIG